MQDREKQRLLIAKYLCGDKQVKDKIIVENIDLIVKIITNNKILSDQPLISSITKVVEYFEEALENYNLEKFGTFEVYVESFINNKVNIEQLTSRNTR